MIRTTQHFLQRIPLAIILTWSLVTLEVALSSVETDNTESKQQGTHGGFKMAVSRSRYRAFSNL